MSRILACLACLALLSLATLPVGFMPALSADGSFILRICDGTMVQQDPAHPQAATHGNHQGMHASGPSDEKHRAPAEKHDGSEHETRCNYAVSATANLPPAPLLVREAVILAEEEPADDQTPLTGIFPAALPPSTGPPEI